MKTWKVTIEHEGKTKEVIVQASFYSDAYINTELQYPGWTIKSITEVREQV